MGVVVSLLRGVNVGGHNTIRMEALRALCLSLGLRDPRTFLQSGNVVFRTDERDFIRLAGQIESGIEREFGFRPDIILRTASELRDIVAGNPFTARRGLEPAKLVVTFLARDPGPEARARLAAINASPEELRSNGRELYLYLPHGIARAKLSPALIEKTLKTPVTGRNWNTVTRLLELAERLQGS